MVIFLSSGLKNLNKVLIEGDSNYRLGHLLLKIDAIKEDAPFFSKKEKVRSLKSHLLLQ